MIRHTPRIITSVALCLLLTPFVQHTLAQADPDAARRARLAQLPATEQPLAALAANEQRYENDLRRAEQSLVGLSRAVREDRGAAFNAKAAYGTAKQQLKLAKGQAIRARAAERLAQGRAIQVTKQLRKMVQVDPTLVAAQEQVEAARQQHDQVREHLLRPLRQTTEYQQALADEAKAEATLREMRAADPPPSPQRFVHASNVLLHRQSAITDLERNVTGKNLSFRTTRLVKMQAILQYWMRRVALSTQAFYPPDRMAALGFVDQARADVHGAETAQAVAEADYGSAKSAYAAAVARYEATAREYEQTEKDRVAARRQLIAARNRIVALSRQRSFLLRGF